jgi:hypothetical protein
MFFCRDALGCWQPKQWQLDGPWWPWEVEGEDKGFERRPFVDVVRSGAGCVASGMSIKRRLCQNLCNRTSDVLLCGP